MFYLILIIIGFLIGGPVGLAAGIGVALVWKIISLVFGFGIGVAEQAKHVREHLLCPQCKEEVKVDALVCKHCGQKFDVDAEAKEK